MSSPGGATNVGEIIGYLILNRSDWDRGVRDTESDANRLGRLSPNIRVTTNAGEAIAQLRAVRAAESGVGSDASKATPFVVNLWAALAAIGPAAVPIAGVAGGALLGLLPIAAAVVLGIKGISNQMKSGALQGTQLAADVNTLKGELTTLEQTAAGGLASGLSKALAGSQPLFKTINADIGTMSAQLGHIVAGAAPALLTIFTQLNPLFTTFGNLVGRGATELEHWANTSTGIKSFVAYVQANLPMVMQFLGNLVTLFGHIMQAAAPMGGVILGGLGVLVRVLDALPIGVLQTLIPLLIAGYAALKTYQGVSAIMAGVNKALDKMGASAAANAAAQTAAAAAVEATAAEEAAVVATAAAAEARARAEAAVEIAAAVEGTNSILAQGATVAAESAIEESAAYQASADAAVAAAAEKKAAAEETALANAATGASMGGILAPIAAVVVGLALFSGALGSNKKAAQEAAAAANSYADSVRGSTDAISAANVAQTNKNLSDKGSLKALDGLETSLQKNASSTLLASAATSDLGLSHQDLTLAVNGTRQQYDYVITALDGVITKNKAFQDSATRPVPALQAQSNAAAKLRDTVKTLRDGLQSQIVTQEQLNTLNEQTVGITDAQAVAAAKLYGLTGTTGVASYLAAQQAAQKNTDQTNAQTLAFQMENNAAGLVNQALQALAGQNLSVAQAQTALGQANLTTIAALKQNGSTVADNTTKGLANRQAIEGSASALRAKLQADAAAGVSTEKATANYRTNAQALLAQIGKLDGTKSAAYRYAQQLLAIPPIVKTKADLQTDAAAAALKAFKTSLQGVKSKVISITAIVNDGGLTTFAATVQRLSNTAGVTVSYGRGNRVAGTKADGGTIGAAANGMTVPGPGGPRQDNHLTWLSTGEEVVSNPWAELYRPLLKSISSGRGLGNFAPASPSKVHAGSAPQIDTVAIVGHVVASVMSQLPARFAFEADKRAFAHISNNGNLALNRRA